MAIPVLRELLDLYPSLPPAERRVADVVLGRPRDVLGFTSSELAIPAAASQPAVSRFCSRLGTRTFAAFKIRLAQELGVETAPAAPAESSFDPLFSSIVRQTEADLAVALRAVETLDRAALEEAAHVLRGAREIVVCGFNLSGSMAWRLAALLHIAGCRARSERDPDDAPWMEDLGAGDVLVVISYRGTVPQLFPTLRRVREQGATVVALTNEAQSPLVGYSDILLLTRAPAAPTIDDYVIGPSLVVQLVAIRALGLAVRRLAPNATER